VSTAKVVGIETEYGIVVDGPTPVNPVFGSSMVVSAYRASVRRDVGWDHTDEQPFRDARGFDVALPPHGASDAELSMANSVLTNGARLYVDHAHPEYATPECTNARDVVVWDKAGEMILASAAQLAAASLPAGSRVLIHKNNTDGKGAAYGTHENYLVPRSLPFGALTEALLPFFVSRIVFVGAGRIGTEFSDADVPFQLSQRADFFEVDVGLETTLKRPLMNTRDEPHADPEVYRRLHVINGDANLCEIATFLKVGTMMLVLDAIEDGYITDELAVTHPVAAMQQISHDPTLRQKVALRDGRRLTAVDIQRAYLAAVEKHLADRGVSSDDTDLVVDWWNRVLEAADHSPHDLAGVVDWATKWEIVEGFAARHALPITHDRVRMVDLQYHDVRQDKGLFQRLVARGRVERLVSDEEVSAAITTPPGDTRAWFRGECIRRFPEAVVAAGWDAIVFDVGREALQRVPMMDPFKGTQATTEHLFNQVSSAAELLDAIQRR